MASFFLFYLISFHFYVSKQIMKCDKSGKREKNVNIK